MAPWWRYRQTSKEQVDRLHAIALEQGGARAKAKPGDRGGGFYAAYFRDLDGNKLNAFLHGYARLISHR